MATRNLLLTVLFFSLSIGTKLLGQYARSFYSAPSPNAKNTSAFVHNGNITSLSIKESTADSLKLMLVDLDDRGITSNYRFLEMPVVTGTEHCISGTAIVGNKLLVNITFNQTSVGKLAHVQIDLSSATITSVNVLSDQFIRGALKSQQKQDSLITYASLSNLQVVRLSCPVNAPSNTNSETTGITFTGSTTFQYWKDCFTMLIDGTDEYFNFDNKINKRTAPNTYIYATLPSTVTGSRGLVKKSNGEIILLQAKSLYRFSSSLTLLGQRAFFLNSGYFNHIYFNGQHIVFYAENNDLTKYRLNYDLSTLDSTLCQRNFDVYGSLNHNNNTYLFGSRIEPVTLNSTISGETSSTIKSSFIVKDYNSSQVPVFNEYNQNLEFHDFAFSTGHLNSMFMQEDIAVSGFQLDFNDQKRPLIFAAQNLLVGINENNDTVGVGRRYYDSNPESTNTLLPGPFTTSDLNSHENVDQYNKGFYVDRYLIDAHVAAIESNNPSYEMPFGIEFWPGNGNTSLGQADQLAGYHDENNNGVYEPLLGDYPKIYGDRCYLNIYHQPENSAYSNNLEIHQYFFSFDCDTSETNIHAMFVKQQYFNRSAIDIDSVFVGTFIDFDNGNYADDFTGTNVDLGMIYAYNGDLFDESDGGLVGFQDTLPAMGMMVLKGPKLYDDSNDNQIGGMSNNSPNGLGFSDGISDNEYYGLSGSLSFNSTSPYPYTDPYYFHQYYNSLEGEYTDGSPQEVNDIAIRHSYFGNSDPYFYSSGGIDHGNNHSEITAANPKGDRRMIGGSGPGYLNSQDTLELLTAYVYGIDSTEHTMNAATDNLFAHGTAIRNAYLNNVLGCGSGFDPYVAGIEKVEELDRISVYPNPFNASIRITGISYDAEVIVCDLNGKVVYQSEIQNNQSIPLDSLAKNVYVMKIIDGDKIYTKRIVKI